MNLFFEGGRRNGGLKQNDREGYEFRKDREGEILKGVDA